jgi:hypothetical protein
MKKIFSIFAGNYKVMRTILILMSVFLAWTTSLSAQITREQADVIVREHIQKEVTRPVMYLYFNSNTPSNEVMVITTHMGETIKIKYPCWVYFLNEYPDVNGPAQRRYFFVKEDNGSLMEVIISHDFGPDDSYSWNDMEISTGTAMVVNSQKQPYPNPVKDLLTLPCNGEDVRVEIYNLNGTRLFSDNFSGNGSCQLNVSFLSAGIYILSIDGERFKIIKN